MKRSKKQQNSYLIPPNYDPTIASYNLEQFQEITYQEHVRNLKLLLDAQTEEIVNMPIADMKAHMLPLARIKKIMRQDEDVRMISADVPAALGKACELFIIELTHLAWIHAEEGKRRTLQREDIAECIARTDSFDFLLDLVPHKGRWSA